MAVVRAAERADEKRHKMNGDRFVLSIGIVPYQILICKWFSYNKELAQNNVLQKRLDGYNILL